MERKSVFEFAKKNEEMVRENCYVEKARMIQAKRRKTRSLITEKVELQREKNQEKLTRMEMSVAKDKEKMAAISKSVKTGERRIMTQQGKRLGKLQEISNEIASQRLMREEIVRENLAREKRKSAWQAL